MSLVPLPWWTSQSTIITRESPNADVARRAATATLPKKQNPMARATSAWWPGGRSALTPTSASPPSSASTIATAPPASRNPAPKVPGTATVSMSIIPPPAAHRRSRNVTCDDGCTSSKVERATSGACTRSQPNQPWALISASSAWIRAGRSGWPGTSWAMKSSSRSQIARRERSSIAHTVIACSPVRSDLVVVGAGAAGLFAALTAARKGATVTLVSARPLAETASYWAQGGAAAALAVDDSPAIHLEDTLEAGRGLTRPSAAEVLTEEAAARVRELQALGVIFDADRQGHLALGLEGGHSRRRIIHAGGSATGRRILRELSAKVAGHPRIEVLEGGRAQRIATVDGRATG